MTSLTDRIEWARVQLAAGKRRQDAAVERARNYPASLEMARRLDEAAENVNRWRQVVQLLRKEQRKQEQGY
jgi:hypothetical protein